MVALLAGTGQTEQAADAAGREQLLTAVGISDPEQRAWVLSDMAEVLAGAGQAGPRLRPQPPSTTRGSGECCSSVTETLAGAGHAGQGAQAAASIDDPKKRAQALAALLHNSAACGSDPEVGRRALELLLCAVERPDFLRHSR